ncbi:hypothetical protein F5148DRAFT_1206134 [Russula earlei]|uniref:Uncharacterized protein n=1 Tax=Russula earlei TaxID=71964 RepID=A0ACC0U6H5_9AGAM|nr:hypothetical protein F5148DRAFT_1206134 [Russula earlei]
MPVTTRRQSRSLLHPNAIDESGGRRSEDRPRGAVRESGGDNDPADGSSPRSFSREEAEGRGSSTSVGPESQSQEADMSEESNYEESDGSPDFDDDFEVTHHVAKKRRKSDRPATSASGRAPSSKPLAKAKRTGISRRIQGRLQNMLSLPLDVLFLIFSELGSMDLVNLARTSNELRRFLMSRRTILVWTVARQNAGATRVPDPPEDMSEPAWALLLFGPAMCSECSTKNIQRVDFALRRRLCTGCRKKNLVPSVKFGSQCPGLKESVMDLLPHTTNGGWAHRRVSSSRFYWKPDLYEMGKRLAELEEDRDSGKPGALQRLETFRGERILLVNSIVQRCPEFEKWAEAEAEAQARNARERRVERRKALKARILAAGYGNADIDWIGLSAVPGANVDKPLTEEAWRHIRTKVESRLSTAREARLRALRCRREREYRARAEQCYSDLMLQVLPMQRLYLPSLSQVGELSCFRDLLNPERDVPAAEWERAAARLPESLSEWMSEHKDRYSSLLPSRVFGTQDKAMEVRLLSDQRTCSWVLGDMSDFAGKLELATSVFRHPDTNTILMGRDICHAWKMKGDLEFLERGAEAVRALLRLLLLDPTTTTASMLDQLDSHFVCTSCPEWRRYSWRSSVLHFIEDSEMDRSHTQWRVVYPDEGAMRGEQSNYDVLYPHRSEAWLCNHCSDDLAPAPSAPFGRISWAVSKTDATRHVQTKHDIKDPIVDVNLFSYPMFGFE